MDLDIRPTAGSPAAWPRLLTRIAVLAAALLLSLLLGGGAAQAGPGTPAPPFAPPPQAAPPAGPKLTETPGAKPAPPHTSSVPNYSAVEGDWNPSPATIVPGATDTGNHCDDCVTAITLPFPFTFYGQSFSSANVSANGNLQFASSSTMYTSSCLPSSTFNYAMVPWWDDLLTYNYPACPGGGCGIYTAVTGAAPRRIFNVEWRVVPRSSPSTYLNFEIRLYEGTDYFEFVYGAIPGQGYPGVHAATGVQSDTGSQSATLRQGNYTGCDLAWSGLRESFITADCTTCTPGDYGWRFSEGVALDPGITRIDGNGCDDCTVPVTLPFAFNFYDQSFTTANVSSNGNLQFLSNSSAVPGAPCLPNAGFNYAQMPYWKDLVTMNYPACPNGVCGIYTSETGIWPNFAFNIEWRAVLYEDRTYYRNFEIRLFARSHSFEYVYGAGSASGDPTVVAGVQRDTGSHFSQQKYMTGGRTCANGANYIVPGARNSYDLIDPFHQP